MARGKYGETIQAVEINGSTFIGTASNLSAAGAVIHASANGTITFHFANIADKVVNVLAGSDWVAGTDCTGVTSSAEIVMT